MRRRSRVPCCMSLPSRSAIMRTDARLLPHSPLHRQPRACRRPPPGAPGAHAHRRSLCISPRKDIHGRREQEARTEGDLPLVNQLAKVDLLLLIGLRVVHLALAPPRVQLLPPRRGGQRADSVRAVTTARLLAWGRAQCRGTAVGARDTARAVTHRTALGSGPGLKPRAARLNLDARGLAVQGPYTGSRWRQAMWRCGAHAAQYAGFGGTGALSSACRRGWPQQACGAHL
jgi:hypothetical protein